MSGQRPPGCPAPELSTRCWWYPGRALHNKEPPPPCQRRPASWDRPHPLCLPPQYVPWEPPHGPSPPGRRQQGQDRGHPVRPALQIRAEIPRGTPATPPCSGRRDRHQHPRHGQEGDGPQPAHSWPGQQPQHGETAQDGEGDAQGSSKGLRWRQQHQNSPDFNPNKGRPQLQGGLSNQPQGCQVPTRGRGRR